MKTPKHPQFSPPIIVRLAEDGRIQIRNLPWFYFHYGPESGKLYRIPGPPSQVIHVSAEEWNKLANSEFKPAQFYGFVGPMPSYIRIDFDFGGAKAPWFVDCEDWKKLTSAK